MKVGLALGGGGIKGMAHIGVLRVLETAQIPIDLVVGSSAGAIAGALYAAGKTPDEMERFALNAGFRQYFARDTSGFGLFSTNGIHRLLEEAIGEDLNIEDLPKPFVCVAVDLDTQQEVFLDSGPLVDAVCASSAYPGLYAPVRIGERMLFDGGILNPVPFDVARRFGADLVLAVDLGAQEPFFATLNVSDVRQGNALWQMFYNMSHQPIFRVVEHSIGIMQQQLRNQKTKEAPPDLVIYPKVRDIGLLDFHLISDCIAAGEAEASRALPEMLEIVKTRRRASIPHWDKIAERIKHAFAWRRAGTL